MKKQIPNLLTLGNLFCGCLALINIFQERMMWAAILVSIAALFDVLDGLVARLLKASSNIGMQLDSLADMVSFGVVPASMAFVMVRYSTQTVAGTPYWAYIVFIIALASAYRLAKFNVDTEQRTYFKGMPTPANALFWAALSAHWKFDFFIWDPVQLVIISVIFSFLLVCNMKMFSFKIKDWSFGKQWIIYLFILLAIVATILFNFLGIALAVVIYPLFSYLYFLNQKSFKVD
ncbi:MAG: CDP-alcohol phosphatidyltransferase family protein [Bacteroidales bacterium]|jgi:CDP-diacylglycerol--serine O-phosphatidyltransferase|nr:CDP-alcohol phosphatidyltransferase family protein [Bacteroidales bacterium]